MHQIVKACMSLCDRWEANPRPGYSELLFSDYSIPDSTHHENITRSKVTITLGSEYQINRTEFLVRSGYRTFLDITEVCGLYLGISVVTLAEIVFYGLTIGKVYKETRRLGKNSIAPTE